MMKAIWYFDFISPFSYLQLAKFQDLPADLDITLKPVVFSALLKHWGHKGPAEIPSKRRFVYRFFKWQADRRGVPFTMPPEHPFNPIPPLRLALVKGADRETVQRIFNFIYAEGRNADQADAMADLGRILGIPDVQRRIADPSIKGALKRNTDEAIAAGVFGVPTFAVDGELFWGDDSTDMLLDFLKGAPVFSQEDMLRISGMPMGMLRA